MKTRYLFPNVFKRIGWILLLPTSILGISVIFFNFEWSALDCKTLVLFPLHLFDSSLPSKLFSIESNNLTDEISAILFLISAIFIAFSKEKTEDEYIMKIRLDSLLWAVYANYLILLSAIIFFTELTFLYVLILNMFTLLIVFILRFHYILYKLKQVSHAQ